MTAERSVVALRRWHVIGWAVGALLIASYVVIFARFSAFSLMDYPNHLARAVVMSDLIFHGGARFNGLFQYHFSAITYVLGDLYLAGAVALFGTSGGTALWIGLVMLSLPFAMLFYLRDSKLGADKQLLIFMLSLYLSTDGCLFMGFLSFRLAVASTLVSFALVQTLRCRWSATLFVVYLIVVVLGYLIHLSSSIFLAAAIGVSAVPHLWLGTTNVRREICLLLPILTVIGWHVKVAIHSHVPTDVIAHSHTWGPWSRKFFQIQFEFMRYSTTQFDRRADKVLLLACVVSVLWSVRHELRRRAFMRPAALEMLLLAGAFFGMYIVLPFEYGAASYLDLRPLALVPLFLILACMQLSAEKSGAYDSGAALTLPLAVLLAVGNLAHLTFHFAKDNVWMSRYRAVIAAITPGASVLPIFPGTNELRQFRHAASFAVIDRGAVIPYLFSGNAGDPQTYFRYTHFPYAPPENWSYHTLPSAPEVDWRTIACTYEFLLVTKPFEFDRIQLSTTIVAENESAALLTTAKQGCVESGAPSSAGSPDRSAGEGHNEIHFHGQAPQRIADAPVVRRSGGVSGGTL